MLLKDKLVEDIKDIVDMYWITFGEHFIYLQNTINGYSAITKLETSRSAVNRDAEIMPTKWENLDAQTLMRIKKELEDKNIYFLKGRMKMRPKGSKHRHDKGKRWEFLSKN